MQRQQLIDRFCDHANAVLVAGGGALDSAIIDELRAHDAALVEHMAQDFALALVPQHFDTLYITAPDARFEQGYELLRNTFAPDVLDPREGYVRTLSRAEPQGWWLIGRFWRVPGVHQYDTAGRLVRFQFDPLSATESIASFIVGSYIALDEKSGMGAISYLVSRPGLRKGGGHGSTLAAQLEGDFRRYAETQGHTLRLMLLESEPDARPFWYKMGYRWPVGSDYVQPAMTIDPDTGEPRSPEVPELLMVKPVDDTDSIARVDLLDAVRCLYREWYDAPTKNDAARQRLESYLFADLLGRFAASLPTGERIPLGTPPVAAI